VKENLRGKKKQHKKKMEKMKLRNNIIDEDIYIHTGNLRLRRVHGDEKKWIMSEILTRLNQMTWLVISY